VGAAFVRNGLARLMIWAQARPWFPRACLAFLRVAPSGLARFEKQGI